MDLVDETNVADDSEKEKKLEAREWCGLPLQLLRRRPHHDNRKANRIQSFHAGSHRRAAAVHSLPDVVLQARVEELRTGVAAVSEADEDPLRALLHHPYWHRSPLARLDDQQKLAWLRSQLIGENREFPTPFGVRQILYADHTASGRSLLFIESFLTQHFLPTYGNTHTDDSYVGARTSRMMRQAEEYIKQSLGGGEDDVLLTCGWGCTAAIKRLQEVMGVAVPSILRERVLGMMMRRQQCKGLGGAAPDDDDDQRWLVFTGPYEHHSNLLSWRQSLAEVREIPAAEAGNLDMGQLEEELRGAQAAGRRKMLGAFSACSNVTGLYTDTRAVARLLHAYGAFACFDFAAGAPHMQMDMQSSKEDGYDAMVMSPHKFIGGPGTPGLLLMTRSLYKLGKSPPSTCGGGTVAYVNGFNEQDTLYYEKIEEREEGGTPPILGKVRCALAFWVKESMGIALIRQREDSYVRKAMKKFSMHPNMKILGSNGEQCRAPILSFLIHTTKQCAGGTPSSCGRPLDGRFVAKLLNDLFGIQARGGCACAGPYGHLLLGIDRDLSLTIRDAIRKGYNGLKPGWTRLSLCYSMTEEEVDYILSAVGFVASYGQRFLALYDFDWRSGDWTHSREKACMLPLQLRGLASAAMQSGQSYVADGREDQLLPVPPQQYKKGWSQRECFRHSVQHAKALSHLLPSSPPPRPVPLDIDSSLLLFQV